MRIRVGARLKLDAFLILSNQAIAKKGNHADETGRGTGSLLCESRGRPAGSRQN
jgi:hypothetical protein